MASTTVAHERALAPWPQPRTDTHGPSAPPPSPPIVAGQKDGGRNTYVTRQKDGTRREGRGETWIKRVTGYLILSSSLATLANHFSSSFLPRVFAPTIVSIIAPCYDRNCAHFVTSKWSLPFFPFCRGKTQLDDPKQCRSSSFRSFNRLIDFLRIFDDS